MILQEKMHKKQQCSTYKKDKYARRRVLRSQGRVGRMSLSSKNFIPLSVFKNIYPPSKQQLLKIPNPAWQEKSTLKWGWRWGFLHCYFALGHHPQILGIHMPSAIFIRTAGGDHRVPLSRALGRLHVQ